MEFADEFLSEFIKNAKEQEKIYNFTNDLTHLINKYSIDSMAKMPDFKMADILVKKLEELIWSQGGDE